MSLIKYLVLFFLWETFWYFFIDTLANFSFNFKLFKITFSLLNIWLKSVQQYKPKCSKEILHQMWHKIHKNSQTLLDLQGKTQGVKVDLYHQQTLKKLLATQAYFSHFITKSPKRSILYCLASLQMLHTTLLLILYRLYPYCKRFSRLQMVTSIKPPILKIGNPFRSGLHEEICYYSNFIRE